MRVIELSNHPGDMLTDASRHRAAAGRRALAGYEGELHAHGQPVAVQRVVVLTHRRSRLGTCRNLTVQLGVSPGFVLRPPR